MSRILPLALALVLLPPLAAADEPFLVTGGAREVPACFTSSFGHAYDCREVGADFVVVPAAASGGAWLVLSCSTNGNDLGSCDLLGYHYPLAARAGFESEVASAHASHFAWSGDLATRHHVEATVAGVATVDLAL